MDHTRLSPWLHSLASSWGERTALKLASRTAPAAALSFAQLAQDTELLAKGMRELGLKAGDSLAIWLPNGPLWLAVHFAAAREGLTTVPLNTWYRASEVAHFLTLADARAVVLDSEFGDLPFEETLTAAVADGKCRNLKWAIDAAAMLGEIPGVDVVDADRLRSATLQLDASARENLEMIVFPTSGTTAMPKLAVHREAALLLHAAAVAARAQIGESDVILGALPPCGAYGYTLLLASLCAGARAIQLDRFDIEHLIDLIEIEHVTVMALTEPIMRSLLDHPRSTASSLRSLRIVFSAGATLQSVVDRAESEFGFVVSNVYGSSEVLALAAFWDPKDDVTTRSSAGGELVSPGMEVSVVDEGGRSLEAGETGELRFRGPILTSGYFRNSQATAAAMTEDGWFLSNDLGSLVENAERQFRYISRMGDALRLKGFLVNPAEIEARLQSHAAVQTAQVVGLPAGNGEDRAVAFVTLLEGGATSEAELQSFCGTNMASYKIPAVIKIIDAFPTTRSANGDKIVKTRLREMAEELMSNV